MSVSPGPAHVPVAKKKSLMLAHAKETADGSHAMYMKLEKLLKVPRSTRTIQLVINIPELPKQSALAPATQQPSRRAVFLLRIWRFIKVLGPALASVAALALSLLSLQEQTSVDQRQQQAALTQEASRVSFVTSKDGNSVRVENLASIPAYDVTLHLSVAVKVAHYQDINLLFSLGDIPPCSYGVSSILPFAKASVLQITRGRTTIDSSNYIVDSMYFIDRGITWDNSGVL